MFPLVGIMKWGRLGWGGSVTEGGDRLGRCYGVGVSQQTLELLADGVAWVHLGFVAFVVLGLVVVVIGAVLRWEWVRNGWFRVVHLAAIGFVAARCWVSFPCPLTVLEGWLRGSAAQGGGSAVHLAHVGVFRGAPAGPFAAGVTVFFAVTLIAFAVYGPRRGTPLGRDPEMRD